MQTAELGKRPASEVKYVRLVIAVPEPTYLGDCGKGSRSNIHCQLSTREGAVYVSNQELHHGAP